MTQSILRIYFNSYQELENQAEIEDDLRRVNIRRRIGNPLYRRILGVLLENRGYDWSINEVAHVMKMERSTISARMHELRAMGLLVFSQRRTSRVTGKANDAYTLVNNFNECVEVLDD